MTQPRVLSIHRTLAQAIRSQRHSGGVVREGVPGTTAERPWGVVAPVRASNRDSRNAV